MSNLLAGCVFVESKFFTSYVWKKELNGLEKLRINITELIFLPIEDEGDRYMYGWWQNLSIVKKWGDTNTYIPNTSFLDILVRVLCQQ